MNLETIKRSMGASPLLGPAAVLGVSLILATVVGGQYFFLGQAAV